MDEIIIKKYFFEKNSYIEEKKWISKLSYLKGENSLNFLKRKKSTYLIFFIIHLLLVPSLDGKMSKSYFNSSYIELKVNGPGKTKLYFKDENNPNCIGIIPPEKIRIDNELQDSTAMEHDLKKEKNNVKLIWNEQNIKELHCFFYTCDKITYVDFSHFNSSLIESISDLFHGCESLVSVNFNNFDTSKVESLHWMFYNCHSLISIDLSNFNTSKVIYTFHMFYSCYSLEFINLTNFDTSKVKDMTEMFGGCENLKEINLSSFNISQAESMFSMFHNCKSLISLDLTNFDTSKVTNTSDMFSGCEKLTSIDISNFDMTRLSILSRMFQDCKSLITINFTKSKAPVLYKLGSLFKNCESLISVDLSNFDTSKVIYMDSMFQNCKSLTCINLSNFDISSVEHIYNLFYGCINLEYINLKNVKEEKTFTKKNDVFKNIPENIVICIYETNSPQLFELIRQTNNECYTIYCSDDWKQHQKKLIEGTKKCVDSCKNDGDKKYELNNICYDKCNYGFFLDKKDSEQKICKCNLEQCLLCSKVEPTKNLCITCNDSYYPKENDPTNLLPYINCYKDPEGYYLDNINKDINIYRECYNSCKSCKFGGNYIKHNCLECKENYTFELIYQDSLNCYVNCSHYYYFDENRNYFCTNYSFCPKEYSKLKPEQRECIKNCSLDDQYQFDFRNICYTVCPKESEPSKEKDNFCEALCDENNPFVIVETQECVDFCDLSLTLSELCIYKYKEDIKESSDKNIEVNEEEKKAQEIKVQDKILDNIEKGFTSEKFDTTNIESGKDEVVESNKMTITLTTTENQKNKENDNTTTINLGECENLLRITYNISDDEKLYMKKIDIVQEGLKIPKVEYDVYSKLKGNNLIKLNLTVCQNSKVDISVPVVITENLDKLNTSSGYYNDICYISISDSGSDITLKDRKNEFIKGNKTVCQDGCEFQNIIIIIKKRNAPVI